MPVKLPEGVIIFIYGVFGLILSEIKNVLLIEMEGVYIGTYCGDSKNI
jgi:hypothetical protein